MLKYLRPLNAVLKLGEVHCDSLNLTKCIGISHDFLRLVKIIFRLFCDFLRLGTNQKSLILC